VFEGYFVLVVAIATAVYFLFCDVSWFAVEILEYLCFGNSRNEKAQCDFEAYEGRMESEDLIGVSVPALRRMKPTPAAAEVSKFFVAAVNVIKVYPMHGSCRDG